MLAGSAWTRYTEIQSQIGMDVPDHMPEGCPGIIIAMQSTSRTEDSFGMIMTMTSMALS